jgi:hypothetical protein
MRLEARKLNLGRAHMIIWSGWGFIVALIVFGASLLAEVSIEASLHDGNYYQSHGWPLALALLGSAVVTWFLGSFLNRQPEQSAIPHRFFFIPMQYWGPILAVVAIGSLVIR